MAKNNGNNGSLGDVPTSLENLVTQMKQEVKGIGHVRRTQCWNQLGKKPYKVKALMHGTESRGCELHIRSQNKTYVFMVIANSRDPLYVQRDVEEFVRTRYS